MLTPNRLIEGIRRRQRGIQRSETWLRWRWAFRNRFWRVTGRYPSLYLTHEMRNWGDALNQYLAGHVAGSKKACSIDIYTQWPLVPRDLAARVHLLVGSILQFADSRCVVWGTGLIDGDCLPPESPAEILAVRGPRTRQALERAGIACPVLYGDPALLLARLYRPANVKQRFRLGLVPHYVDRQNEAVHRLAEDEQCTVIDVKSDTEPFVDRVCECEAIASSSLHGLIVAQTYGVPAVWMRLSNALEGGNFKFQDYYASLGRDDVEPVEVGTATSVRSLCERAVLHEMPPGLDELARRCPLGSWSVD